MYRFGLFILFGLVVILCLFTGCDVGDPNSASSPISQTEVLDNLRTARSIYFELNLVRSGTDTHIQNGEWVEDEVYTTATATATFRFGTGKAQTDHNLVPDPPVYADGEFVFFEVVLDETSLSQRDVDSWSGFTNEIFEFFVPDGSVTFSSQVETAWSRNKALSQTGKPSSFTTVGSFETFANWNSKLSVAGGKARDGKLYFTLRANYLGVSETTGLIVK